MPEVAISNHYVPQFYLRAWIDEQKGKLNVYHTVRANDGQHLWSVTSPKNMACRDRFYTGTISNHEDASLENMLHDLYEDPASVVIARLREDCEYEPTRKELDCLASYFAAQLFRTPASFEWESRIIKEVYPKLVEKTVASVVKSVSTNGKVDHSKIERQREMRGRRHQQSEPVNVPIKADIVDGGVLSQVLIGKSMFSDILATRLSTYAAACRQNVWKTIPIPDGMELITSDNPALRLSRYKDGAYKLEGGIRQKNCVLALPVTPRVLLFSQVGASFQDLDTFKAHFGRGETDFFNRLTAESAMRFVFVRNRTASLNIKVHEWRPSIVDKEQFELLREADKDWHWDNVKAEQAFYSEGGDGVS